MTDLIAIDPGMRAGVAVFRAGELERVDLVVDAVGTGWRWDGPVGLPVVCEVPQHRKGSRVRAQDLITLSISAGYLIGAVKPCSVALVFQQVWKGQRPKDVDNAYTIELLNDQERHILEGSKVPTSQRHNVVDAIGIGLWALKRR